MPRFFQEVPWSGVFYALCGLAGGLALGVGAYTFIYAKGYSYLSNDPQACVNCHVMRNQYDGWVKSTHHAAAHCNDCHTPHQPAGKYMTKARNGFWHSFYFTAGTYPDNIRIKRTNRGVAEANCRRCHQDVVMAMDGPHGTKDRLSCVSCHGSVGHS